MGATAAAPKGAAEVEEMAVLGGACTAPQQLTVRATGGMRCVPAWVSCHRAASSGVHASTGRHCVACMVKLLLTWVVWVAAAKVGRGAEERVVWVVVAKVGRGAEERVVWAEAAMVGQGAEGRVVWAEAAMVGQGAEGRVAATWAA